jgi:GTP-binding protein
MEIKSAKFMRGVVGTDKILTDDIPQVAFIGRSNVGKSSVINSLVKSNTLVKTGKKPGKTTEINFFMINNKMYFVDLPGYGFAHGGQAQIEKIRNLIIWYLTESGARPRLVIIILDIKAGVTDFDLDMIDILRQQDINYIIVANKSDKLNQKEVAKEIAKIKYISKEDDIILYSATDKSRPKVILDRILV